MCKIEQSTKVLIDESYSTSQEILQYFKDIADKYQLYKYIKLKHRVQSGAWDEESGTWKLKITDDLTGETIDDWCDIFINGCGILK